MQDRQPVASPGDASVTAVLHRNSEGRFNVVFQHRSTDETVRLSSIGPAGDHADQRSLLCTDDILKAVDGSALDGATLEQAQKLIAAAGDVMVVVVQRPALRRRTTARSLSFDRMRRKRVDELQESSTTVKRTLSFGRREHPGASSITRSLSFGRRDASRVSAPGPAHCNPHHQQGRPQQQDQSQRLAHSSSVEARLKVGVRRTFSFEPAARRDGSRCTSAIVSTPAVSQGTQERVLKFEPNYASCGQRPTMATSCAPGSSTSPQVERPLRLGVEGGAVPIRTLASVVADFHAEGAVELSARRGEILVIIKDGGAPVGWSWACSPAGAGLVPTGFLSMLLVPGFPHDARPADEGLPSPAAGHSVLNRNELDISTMPPTTPLETPPTPALRHGTSWGPTYI